MWCINRQWERGCLCCATGTMFRSIVTISPFRSYPDCFSSVSCLLKLQVFLQYKPFGKLQLAIGQTVWDSLLADPHKYINIINFFMMDFLVLGLFPINPEDVKIVLHATIPRWFGQILGHMRTTNWLYLIRKYCCKENALFFWGFEFLWDWFWIILGHVIASSLSGFKTLKTHANPATEGTKVTVRESRLGYNIGHRGPDSGNVKVWVPPIPPKRLSLHSHTWRWPQIYEQYPPKQTFKLFAFFLQSRIEDNSRVLSVLCLRFYGHVKKIPRHFFGAVPPA